MSPSSRFQEMADHIESAAACLLPSEVDPTGAYTPEAYIRASGFRVLVHAEIEAYIEDRVREIALSAVRAWKAGQGPSHPALCLIAYSGIEMKQPPVAMQPKGPAGFEAWAMRARLGTKLDSAMRSFAYSISQNHGIKEENLLRLLLPVGIALDDLDTVFVADMNSFSELRGEAAHSSASARRRIDPSDDRAVVQSITSGLMRIDAILDALLAQVPSPTTLDEGLGVQHL